ncbi:hypothetical protein BU16DRAFT_537881 [Lophium mytilinum]|uniref:Uncharacterized protein n=1 Tax=Lophium mytilinum TaxID=390894 RepID=A0A6A6QY68_9PEZI|nr:hypothetical protein BU16DRAFT_537881 [Lophium mytilinum]
MNIQMENLQNMFNFAVFQHGGMGRFCGFPRAAIRATDWLTRELALQLGTPLHAAAKLGSPMPSKDHYCARFSTREPRACPASNRPSEGLLKAFGQDAMRASYMLRLHGRAHGEVKDCSRHERSLHMTPETVYRPVDAVQRVCKLWYQGVETQAARKDPSAAPRRHKSHHHLSS